MCGIGKGGANGAAAELSIAAAITALASLGPLCYLLTPRAFFFQTRIAPLDSAPTCEFQFFLTARADCSGDNFAMYSWLYNDAAPTIRADNVMWRVAGQAGLAASVFFALAILLTVLHVASTSMHAHARRMGKRAAEVNCCASERVGLACGILSFIFNLLSCCLAWISVGNVVRTLVQQRPPFTTRTYQAGPATYAAIAGLVLSFVGLCFELGARCCYSRPAPAPQRPKQMAIAVGNPAGSVAVSLGGGAVLMGPAAAAAPTPAVPAASAAAGVAAAAGAAAAAVAAAQPQPQPALSGSTLPRVI
jgi:hypothetical protein